MTKKERLEAIIEHYNEGKPSLFAKSIGVAPSTISSWLARDTMDYDLLFAKCENISSEWLLTGQGPMLKQEQPMPPTNPNMPTTPTETPHFEQLLATITQQAEEIGRLKARIEELERRRGDNASDAATQNARVG